jgi:hypothetical protein
MTATMNRQAKAMKAMPPGLGPPIFTSSRVDSAKAEGPFGIECEYECKMMAEGEGRAAVDPRVARMKRDIKVVMSFMVALILFLLLAMESMIEWMFIFLESMLARESP